MKKKDQSEIMIFNDTDKKEYDQIIKKIEDVSQFRQKQRQKQNQ